MAMFFVRIFGAKRSFNISVAVVLCIVWAWAIMVILECFLLCRPFAYNWDKSVGGSCGDRRAAFIVAGVLNVITDLMVMGLPLPHVWTLKLNMQKKIGLTSVFCVGIVYATLSTIDSAIIKDPILTNSKHLRHQCCPTSIPRSAQLRRPNMVPPRGRAVVRHRAPTRHRLRQHAFL